MVRSLLRLQNISNELSGTNCLIISIEYTPGHGVGTSTQERTNVCTLGEKSGGELAGTTEHRNGNGNFETAGV